jgi:hypothetical protein
MLIADYKKFVRQVALELRNKSAEEQRRRLEAVVEDIKREIRYGGVLKK